MMLTLEEYYLTKADECRQANDSFGAAYYMKQAFIVSCMGE